MDFTIRCHLNGMELRGSDIAAMWERRPELPELLPYSSTSAIDKHNREEGLEFLQYLRF